MSLLIQTNLKSYFTYNFSLFRQINFIKLIFTKKNTAAVLVKSKTKTTFV